MIKKQKYLEYYTPPAKNNKVIDLLALILCSIAMLFNMFQMGMSKLPSTPYTRAAPIWKLYIQDHIPGYIAIFIGAVGLLLSMRIRHRKICFFAAFNVVLSLCLLADWVITGHSGY